MEFKTNVNKIDPNPNPKLLEVHSETNFQGQTQLALDNYYKQ